MVFPILLVSLVKQNLKHRVHKRADGFYHGRKTVSRYNVVFNKKKQYVCMFTNFISSLLLIKVYFIPKFVFLRLKQLHYLNIRDVFDRTGIWQEL